MPQGNTELVIPRQMTREFSVSSEDINKDERTIALSFSSEEPVLRNDGYEILDHAAKSVRLARLNADAPCLFNHERNIHLGRVCGGSIENRRGRAIIKFSRSAVATEKWQDVLDGVLRAVSVQYRVYAAKIESRKDGIAIYRVTDWEPYEISFVTIPADITVGVGRDANGGGGRETKTLTIEGETKMPDAVVMPPAERGAEINVNETRELLRREETKRAKELRQLGEQYGQRDIAEKAIEDGISVQETQCRILAEMGKARQVRTGDTALDVSQRDLSKYSLLRAIQCVIQRRAVDGLEGELSQEYGRKIGRQAEGFFVPPEVLNSRAFSVTGDAGANGGKLVAATEMGFIDVLQKRLAIGRMGATTLSGLQGDIYFNKQSGDGVGYWLSETAEVTASDFKVTSASMTPKRLAALCLYSKQLLIQSNPSVDSLVRTSINRVLAQSIDAASLFGTGTGNTPKGILHADNHTKIYAGSTAAATAGEATNANGAGLTWSDIVNLESAVADVDADIGTLGYLTNSKVRGKLKQTEKAAGTAQFVWQDGQLVAAGEGILNGYRAVVSNLVPKNLSKGESVEKLSALIYGNFADVIFGQWGGMDIVTDPYTLAASNQVRIVVNTLSDVLIRRKESFAAIEDILA